MAKAISEAYQLGLNEHPVKNLSGGIIYFDFNITPEFKGYKEAVRMGFVLAALALNKFLGG